MNRFLRLFIFMFVVFVVILLTPSFTNTTKGNITLLTVATEDNISYGGVANVELVIRPGSGHVFLATFPFSKLDTQISTRFANEIACSMVDVDCDKYDFFYTITASSTIIGGPSAGAALAALTVALLDNQPMIDNVAITGTISAGGIVGSVGGVHEKVSAAANSGIGTVIIPKWDEPSLTNVSNASFENITLFLDNISIIKVGNLNEVLFALTNKQYVEDVDELVVHSSYTYIMQEVAVQLCNRSRTLLDTIPFILHSHELFNISKDFLKSAVNASENKLFYSQASYCFSANLRLRELQLDNFSAEKLDAVAVDVRVAINESLSSLDRRSLETFTDLQTRAIVDERLREAEEYISSENLTARNVAYAIERYKSGVIWSNFFELPGERLVLDEAHLKRACEVKLSEVEEREGYLSFLFGSSLLDDAELSLAYDSYLNGDYALCLFKASKAKAQVDMIISSVSMSVDTLSLFVEEKLLVAKSIIHREIVHDRFPIMGYSYYEYAGSLSDDDPYLAALYASYALELGDLSLYFSPPKNVFHTFFSMLSTPFLLGFFSGLLIAVILLFLIPVNSEKKKSHKKRTRRMP